MPFFAAGQSHHRILADERTCDALYGQKIGMRFYIRRGHIAGLSIERTYALLVNRIAANFMMLVSIDADIAMIQNGTLDQ